MPDGFRQDETAGRHTMISEIEGDTTRSEILTAAVPLAPILPDEIQNEPAPNSGNENFSNFVSDEFNPFITHIENIKRYQTTIDGRTYLKFQDEIYTLEIVKFKISGICYISVNSHVMRMRDFLAVNCIEYVVDTTQKLDIRNSTNNKIVNVKFTNGHEFLFQGCTTNIFVKALSDEEMIDNSDNNTFISRMAKFFKNLSICKKEKI